jgi:hypothetical protein
MEPGRLVVAITVVPVKEPGADLEPAASHTPAGGVAQSSNAFGVFFNGIPAPILCSMPSRYHVHLRLPDCHADKWNALEFTLVPH